MSDYGVWFESLGSPKPWNEFNLLLAWVTPPMDYALPTGTFPAVDPHTYQSGADPLFFGGPDVFGNVGPNGQYNWGTLYRYGSLDLESEMVPRMTFSPVPEPSTYANGAVVLLLVAVGLKRRQTRRTISAV